ncbi:hypothetical protein NM688_g7814 [Phlebia brevispora]|uniref:Uncharacterized protein n=1 Tax=Phlebia brevispora TaxID=194682 RepID=A0ACC1S0V6_9APHY|nr:hypothetical protein NM688_g7814 [Phlebia brevispora]
MPSYPDEELPYEQQSIVEFNANASELYAAAGLNGTAEDYEDVGRVLPFLRFVLAGRKTNEAEAEDVDARTRVNINAREDDEGGDDEEFTLTRDFDSVIGMTKMLPFTEPLYIYPVPNFKFTMKYHDWNHMSWPIKINGLEHEVPLYKIPNFKFAQVDKVRAQTLIFFPDKYNPGAPVGEDPSIELVKEVYERVIHPAVKAVCPARMAHWPPTFKAAMAKNQDSRGRLHFMSEVVSDEHLEALEKKMELFARQSGLGKIFFVHELRGIKNGTVHDAGDVGGREDAFDVAMKYLDMTRAKLHEWHVDVVIEIAREDHVLLWLKTGRVNLIRIGLPTASVAAVRAFCCSKQMKSDVVSQLYDLQGCRGRPGYRAGHADGVEWMNIYTTEKALTYQKHAGAFRCHSAKDLFPENMEKLLSDVGTQLEVYREAMGHEDPLTNEWVDVQLGGIRYEVRVPFEEALDTLGSVTVANFRLHFISLSGPVFWAFKYWRCKAIQYVLQNLYLMPEDARLWNQTLQLGGIQIYMLNALMYRPGEQEWDKDLVIQSAAFSSPPVDAEDVEEDELEPETELEPMLEDRGAYFLADIVLNQGSNILRLPDSARTLSMAALSRVYNVGMVELSAKFNQLSITRQRDTIRKKRAMQMARHGRTQRVEEAQPEVLDEVPLITNLVEMNVTLAPRTTLEGLDVLYDAEREENYQLNLLGNGNDIHRELHMIWRQFPIDMVTTSPNGRLRTEPQWITLTAVERGQTKDDLFKGTALPFRGCHFKRVNAESWSHTFDLLFPPKNQQISEGRWDGFGRCEYYLG